MSAKFLFESENGSFMSDSKDKELSNRQVAMIAGEGLLSAIPYIGSALAKFSFGVLTERRIARIERTLSEVAETVGEDASKSAVNEHFVSLLENISPELSRATDEEKRQRFRDLLTNAAELSENSEEWAAANLAADILKEIDTPGLIILAALARLEEHEKAIIAGNPVPQILRGVDEREFVRNGYVYAGETQQTLPYEWAVIDHWVRQLGQLRLIEKGSHGRDSYVGARLADLGRYLVKWVLREEP